MIVHYKTRKFDYNRRETVDEIESLGLEDFVKYHLTDSDRCGIEAKIEGLTQFASNLVELLLKKQLITVQEFKGLLPHTVEIVAVNDEWRYEP